MERRVGTQGLEVLAQGLGWMSEFYADEDEAIATVRVRSSSASPSSTPPTCTGLSRMSASPAASCASAGGASSSPPSSATSEARRGVSSGSAATRLSAAGMRRLARAPRHRLHRPLIPASRRLRGAYRGDRRRDGRSSRAGQGQVRRAVGGGAGDHPPRARRTPDQRASDRVLAVEPRPRGRDPSHRTRAGDRFRLLQSARSRLPLRLDPLARRPRRERLSAALAALPGRELRPQPRALRPGGGARRGEGRNAGSARVRLGPPPGRRPRPDPGNEAPSLPRGGRSRGGDRAFGGGARAHRRGGAARYAAGDRYPDISTVNR
jgi:hypothetical protein